MPVTDATVLMILPALLVLVGMLTGYCFWGWLRGIDQNTVDDLHDEIRSLGRQIERDQTQANELLDLQFENQELQLQFDSLTESVSQSRQQSTMELQEVTSLLEVRDTELKLAESSIADLRIQIGQLKSERAETRSIETTEIAANSVHSKSIAASHAGQAKNQSQNVDLAAAGEPLRIESEPSILRLELPEKKVDSPPSLDIEYGGEVIEDENLGLVYSRPPIFNDNLQLISGIASKLENQLNEYGVYTFQQIMLWSAHNIDQFSSLLDTFQDRIQRDDWVGQAESFYQRTRKMRKAA